MNQRESETERFLELSDHERGLAILRQIRDSPDSSTTEKLKAINDIARLTGADADASTGPGGMTRAELQQALAEVTARIAAEVQAKGRA